MPDEEAERREREAHKPFRDAALEEAIVGAPMRFVYWPWPGVVLLNPKGSNT